MTATDLPLLRVQGGTVLRLIAQSQTNLTGTGRRAIHNPAAKSVVLDTYMLEDVSGRTLDCLVLKVKICADLLSKTFGDLG